MINETLQQVTTRIIERSKPFREEYEDRMRRMKEQGVQRAHLSCGNLAHAYAAMSDTDKAMLTGDKAPNIGIVTAYNDMLSAHQPYEHYPELIRNEARKLGATAQVAGGVPAMCDGVTQGQVGMELSLFSRDVIAQAAAIALSHNTYDAAMFLGICDKIVPGLIIATASFGHIPAIYVPSGPMTSGISNDEKSQIRKAYTEGKIGRTELMAGEMASYHSAGTCTFYGTANTNQMLMEFMGLHLPGSSFINPGTEIREALSAYAVQTVLKAPPAYEILAAKNFVNGLVGLLATGGSTNLVLHMVAMARSAGVVLTWDDFDALAQVVPLMAKVYPNGLADVNNFHAAGGLGFMIGSLLDQGLFYGDNKTVYGESSEYSKEPSYQGGKLHWVAGAKASLNTNILRGTDEPFQPTGGLKHLKGNLGSAVMKVSAVDPSRHIIEAPARVFEDQDEVKAAFKAGDLEQDAVIVVRYQGPAANGMPELHSLTPALSILQDRGFRVALVTDGRMSGASGKIPAAIHLSPEAAVGGLIGKLQDGDLIRVDAVNGTIEVLTEGVAGREMPIKDLSANQVGWGRELFTHFRMNAAHAELGASQFYKDFPKG